MPPESEQPQAKQVPLRTLLVTLLIVALIAVFLVWWKGGEAMDRICRPLIDAAVARAEPDVEAELPMIVEEVGGAGIGEAKNSATATNEFAKRIGYLFNKPEIRSVL